MLSNFPFQVEVLQKRTWLNVIVKNMEVVNYLNLFKSNLGPGFLVSCLQLTCVGIGMEVAHPPLCSLNSKWLLIPLTTEPLRALNDALLTITTLPPKVLVSAKPETQGVIFPSRGTSLLGHTQVLVMHARLLPLSTIRLDCG